MAEGEREAEWEREGREAEREKEREREIERDGAPLCIQMRHQTAIEFNVAHVLLHLLRLLHLLVLLLPPLVIVYST